jgi:hypothetical protein
MFMAAYLASSNLAFLFIDTIPLITAISFMLINVRIGLGWAQHIARSSEKLSTHSVVTLPFRTTQSAIRSTDDRQQRSGNFQMHSLTVHVERTVVKDSGSNGTVDDSVVEMDKRKDTVLLDDSGSGLDHSTKRIYDRDERYM